MKRQPISTPKAPPTIGPYSQAIIADGFIFTSGQLPLDRDGNLVEGDIRAQARQCLENIKAILEAAGAGMDDLVKVTVYVTDMNDFAAINEVYASYFPKEPPARSFVQVAALPRGVPIELEGIAMKKAR
ncbi:MAG: RidA family protein [Candidatus Acetothermia bacterium]|nr:RidA family protein [Candidatus Acetothermia bacterium]MDH7505616.1 RidA family protein [Candidatus Acetothermia bacterium]